MMISLINVQSLQVLLIMWSTAVEPKYELLELFAGSGQVGDVWRPHYLIY